MSVPTDTRTFKVVAVSPKQREWNSTKGGPMLSHYVRLDGVDLNAVEIAQKTTTAAPAAWRCRTVAAPSPPAPPVTIADFPFRSTGCTIVS